MRWPGTGRLGMGKLGSNKGLPSYHRWRTVQIPLGVAALFSSHSSNPTCQDGIMPRVSQVPFWEPLDPMYCCPIRNTARYSLAEGSLSQDDGGRPNIASSQEGRCVNSELLTYPQETLSMQ